MNGARMVGIVLVIGGILALAMGGFTYTKSTSEANLGPISLEVKDKETVNIPLWAGVAAVVVGAGLLIGSGRRA
jgi:uncharacterized membrane protein YidH (DUF202 family)